MICLFLGEGINMEFFEKVGKNISLILQEKEINQTTLAEKMGISKQVMSKIINGQKAINILEMKHIASILETNVDRIMNISEEYDMADESLVMLMGAIKTEKAKNKMEFLNNVIDEIVFLEDLQYE